MDTPLVKALELFLSYRVSSVPVVNHSGHLVAVYAKADVVVILYYMFVAGNSDSIHKTTLSCPAISMLTDFDLYTFYQYAGGFIHFISSLF